MKSKIKIWLNVIISSIIIIAVTTPTSALTEAQLEEFDANGSFYWNPDGSSSCTIGLGSYSGNVSAGLSTEQAGFIDTYHNIAEQLSVEYGIPWETVMAQGILESGAGTSRFALERNNFFGIGAFDSNPDAARDYDTPEAGWRGYYENIATTPTYRNHGAFQNSYAITYTPKTSSHDRLTRDNITNPYDYLQTIWDSGYATDPSYYDKNAPLITAIINRANENGWKTSVELANAYPEMITNAATYATGSTPTAGSSNTSYTGTACITPDGGIGSGNGDINATAISLGWPDRTHEPTDPTPAYAQALRDTGVYLLGDRCSKGGYSCDAFVATVMRYSGADTNFPCCGAPKLKNYLDSHPELYTKIGSANSLNTSDLRPGDIRASNSHIEFFVQLADGSFRIASASHCDRTGDYGGAFYQDDDDTPLTVYRKK